MPPDSPGPLGALKLTTFHHLGLACRTMAAEEAALALVQYRREGALFDDPLLGIRCCFLTASCPDAPRIELVEPRPDSNVLEPWLQHGIKLYHMAFFTSDLDDALLALKRQRGRMLVPPTPAVAFGHRPVSFVMLPNLMLIELITAP